MLKSNKMPEQNIEKIERIFQVTELSMDPRNYLGGFFKSQGWISS